MLFTQLSERLCIKFGLKKQGHRKKRGNVHDKRQTKSSLRIEVGRLKQIVGEKKPVQSEELKQ